MRFVLPALFLLLAVLHPVQAGQADPQQLLQEITDQLIEEIHRDPQRLKDVGQVRLLAERYILPHIDFQAAGQLALGKYWRTASVQQRRRFVEEFRALLLHTYLRSINNYQERVIQILPARFVQEHRADVDAEVEQPGGPPVHVHFRLHRVNGDWLIYDIAVEGISLVATHRSAFAREISAQGLDSLIARLARMNNR
jgi:phospholipid transport system substrate-binding protein